MFDTDTPIDTRHVSKVPTQKEMLLGLATFFMGRGPATAKTLRNVEHLSLAELRATKVAGTVGEYMVGGLLEMGVRVGDTYGELMNTLGLGQAEMNEAICYCQNGDQVVGLHTCEKLKQLAARLDD